MPQISTCPPPYSREWSFFPPPLPVDVDHRVWNFQCAFENAREIVRWAVVNTFKIWQADWPLKGEDIRRADVQQAYTQAPDDLILAIDWQLKWDTAAIIRGDYIRRCLERNRRIEEGTHEEILSPQMFEREFNAASQATQRATLMTFSGWALFNSSIEMDPPHRDDLMYMYRSASRPLQAALCFVLEMGLDFFISETEDIERRKVSIQRIIDLQRAEVRRWDLEGKAVGLW